MGNATHVRLVTDALIARHPQFPAATVERLVARTFAGFRDAPIRAFLPILVERQVAAWLRYADGSAVAPTVDLAPPLPRRPQPTGRLAR